VPDDPMTRNNDRNVIVVIRHADSSRCSWLAETLGDITVSASLPVRYVQQFTPDRNLKWGAINIQRDIESGAFSLKVLLDLLDKWTIRVNVHDPITWNAVSEL
jgi:hypothetical protein